MTKKIMIIAGEASGDLHGEALIKALLKKEPDLIVFGVGGNRMQQAGMKLIYHINDLAYIGLVEIARHIFFFRRLYCDLVDQIKANNPDLVILIDYPGFNLRFAKKAKKMGCNVFYFIAPQVWAWAQYRAAKMARYIDRLAVLFPFEPDFFQKYGLPTDFVGHPLVESLNSFTDKTEFFKTWRLDAERPVLALLPGSRKQELQTLLPSMLETAKKVKLTHPELQICIGKAETLSTCQIRECCELDSESTIVENDTYSLVKYARAAMVASGTATLETAFLLTPFMILYRVSPLTYLIGKRMVKLPYIGLANVIAGEKVAQEFIQNLHSGKMAKHLETLLYDKTHRTKMVDKLERIKAKLGEPGAAEKAANIALTMIKPRVIE
jgi:lipid-A-disaccharide synthase